MGGFIPAIAAIASVGQAVQSLTQKAPEAPQMPQNNVPAPAVDDSAAKSRAEVERRKRAMARSQTVFTSPLGIAGQAAVNRKVLLGQ